VKALKWSATDTGANEGNFECDHAMLDKRNAEEMGGMVSQAYFRCLRAVRDER
jgi:hypothetical protein